MKRVLLSATCALALFGAFYSNANCKSDVTELQLADVEAMSQTTVWEHPEIEILSEPHNAPGYASFRGSGWFWVNCDWGHGSCLSDCPAN